jgi:hypothetical protein
MWRVGSTAETVLTAKKNNKMESKYQCRTFNLSALEAEFARRLSSGLKANPELLLPNNIDKL